MKIKRATFKFKPFSRKQLQIMKWWTKGSPHHDKEMLICDGSVRAGKTVVMIVSFIFWAMTDFNEQQFILAGKTIGSLRRNVVRPLKNMLSNCKGFIVKEHRSENYLEITYKGKTNYFFMFGGKDEGSQDLVQGLTAAGAFYDEVALMPESFVNQAQARLSVDGAKSWFNCNPAGPGHWFKKKFIDKAKELNALHIHFLMEDNPSLSQRVIDRYKCSFSGVFYKRYILGLWVLSDGAIYSNFDRDKMVVDLPADTFFEQSWVSIDYGTLNATVFKLWRLHDRVWYCTDEYYYSGRETKKQKTDEDYASDLEEFYMRNNLKKGQARVILDPSAASFRASLKRRGFSVKSARNDVLSGIRAMMSAMNSGLIMYSSKCVNTFKEFGLYVWDEKASEKGEDKPVKENDHCADADRYFVYTVLRKQIGNP
ncbi:PBSX family phage terminase large subunit [Lactococcus sp.]|uniref:PBSX family phage terminase large subunit n=1 Tax=Lactococcus sp. TaxID=44273 RepID=UPI0035AFF422